MENKTVAVEAFEGNNLVLVDEGHKGSSGDVWMGYRQKLTEEGFSFEYSATFGQAISAKSNAKDRKAMFDQYGKATLLIIPIVISMPMDMVRIIVS